MRGACASLEDKLRAAENSRADGLLHCNLRLWNCVASSPYLIEQSPGLRPSSKRLWMRCRRTSNPSHPSRRMLSQLVPTSHLSAQDNYVYVVSSWHDPIAILRAFNDSLLRLYASITKQDVVLGNYVIRSKQPF